MVSHTVIFLVKSLALRLSDRRYLIENASFAHKLCVISLSIGRPQSRPGKCLLRWPCFSTRKQVTEELSTWGDEQHKIVQGELAQTTFFAS